MRLPPELQSLVCRDLTKAELKVARLVCKSLDQAAIPFLYDEVFVAARYRDLEIADLVTSRFGTYVKTILLSCVHYAPLSMVEAPDGEVGVDRMTLARIDTHREHALEVYCRARQDNLKFYESGEFNARLCRVLSKSPNCRKMILTDRGNGCGGMDGNNTYQLHPHDPWRRHDLCPFKTCELSDSDHVSFQLRPIPPYRMTPNPIHLAMSAISSAKCTITELAMIHDSDTEYFTEGSFLAEDAFVMTMEQSYCPTLQFQHLSKLRIRLGEEEEEKEGPQAGDSHTRSPIAKALSTAVNLESLFIDSNNTHYLNGLTAMSSFLRGCQFPKLSSLILRSMDSTEDELLEFLKASPDLKHFTLIDFILVEGSWEITAQRLRSALRLKSIIFHELFGGPLDLEYRIYYSKDRQLIDDFFLHNGSKNPFTKEALEPWYGEDAETRGLIVEDPDCEERYRTFR